MGCDIHFHIEVKIDNKREHFAAPDVNRWYWLFGILAGVRGEDSPIVKPKGFPKDASNITRLSYEWMGRDAHTPSWLNSKEILKLQARLKKERETWLLSADDEEERRRISWNRFDLECGILNTYFFGNGFTSWLEYDDVKYKPDEITDVRFVFWFDN